MTAPRFVFTEDAETQFFEILDYLANESEEAAVRVRDAIYDAVRKLAETPGIGHTREDLTARLETSRRKDRLQPETA